jgi:hypothetical protein
VTAHAELAPKTAVAHARYTGLTSPIPERWSRASLAAFRFTFLYFGAYVLTTQMWNDFLAIPSFGVPELSKLAPMRNLVMWVGHTVFHVKPILAPTGSGDTTYDWTLAFTMVTLALIGTVVWSIVDRKPTNYDRLSKWFRLFIRFALGTSLFSYGFAKLIPLQMPTLFLSRLLEPYGNFSPMGVIWYSIGAAPGYEMFLGSAEVIAGLLVMLPWTTLLGGLISAGVMTGVFIVNMTYDVPVKLFSFHLILFSLIVIAPDVRRLLNMFVLNRVVVPRTEPQFGRTARANRRWRVAQLVFLVWLIASNLFQHALQWKSFGGGAPKSALFGIWDIESMSIDGVVHPPLLTDSTRYSHAVFQTPAGMTLQRMDQTFQRYGTVIDTLERTISLKKGTDTSWKASLAYQRPTPTQLTLEGSVDGKHIQMQMTLHDLNKFLLVNRGFNWVQEQPLNR